MYAMLLNVWAVLDANLGRCPKCMRQSLLAAACAWTIVFVLQLLRGEHTVAVAATVVAFALSTLWVSHLVAYAARSVAVPDRRDRVTSHGPLMSRRETIPAFARALGAMALATAWPATRAFADAKCDCSKCTSEQYCCPTANGYCGCFPTACPKK